MSVQKNKTLMPHRSEIIRIGRLLLLMALMGISGSCNSAGGKNGNEGVTVRWPAEWGSADPEDSRVIREHCNPPQNNYYFCDFKSPHNQPFTLSFSIKLGKAKISKPNGEITLSDNDLSINSPIAGKNPPGSYSIYFPEKFYKELKHNVRNVDLLTASDQKPCKKIIDPKERKVTFSVCGNVQQGIITEFILKLNGYEDKQVRMSESLSVDDINSLELISITKTIQTDQESRWIEFPKPEYDRLKDRSDLENVKLLQESGHEPCLHKKLDETNHKIIFNDCKFQYDPDGSTSFYLDVPNEERSKKFVMKQSWPEKSYNLLWPNQASANPTVNLGSVMIQFPKPLYEALKKDPSKVHLYPETETQACKYMPTKDADQIITFSGCDIQGRTPSFFYIDIAGFDREPISSALKHTETEPFKLADDLSTKPISIGNKDRKELLTLNQIGVKRFINENKTLCKQSYTVTYEYLFNLDQNSLPVPVETDAQCHPIMVRWPKAWSEPTIAKDNRKDTQKIRCDDDSQDLSKQTCNYITKASDHFILEWKGGLIATQVYLKEQSQPQEIKNLTIRFPKDDDGILKGHPDQDNKSSLCERLPFFEFQNIQVCNPSNQNCAPTKPIESDSVLSFNWADPSLPSEIRGTFVQKTQNPKYAPSIEKIIPIGDHYALPKITELQAFKEKKQLPVEINFDPPDQKPEYSEKRELLLFKSEQDCIKTEKPQNVYYTEQYIKELKLTVCEENWAKISGDGRQADLTQCALGKNSSIPEPTVRFALKVTPGYGEKRWLIVVSETQGLDQQKRNIIDALKGFIKNNDKKPITIIASGAKVRKLLRTEEVAGDSSEKKLWGSIDMNNTIQNAILDLGGIESEISLEKIQKMLYITDSKGLKLGDELSRIQKAIIGPLIIDIPITVVTPKYYCDIWIKAKVKHCDDISDIPNALAKFKEDRP